VPINLQVFDSSGQRLPTQIVSRSEKSATVLFTGKVPSLGYSVFDVRPAAAETEATGELKVSDHRLENSRYVVKIDAAGDVSSVYDKLNQKELLQAPARLAYMHENPSQFPAWNMDWSDQKMPPRAYVTGPASFKIVEEGPVRVAVQVTRRSEGSKFVQTLRLGSGDAADRLDFVTQIDWQGKESALKAEFPLSVSNPKATYNWGLGTVMRGNDEPKKYEVASHGWIDLTNEDKSYGASILDDCKYGSDKPNDNTLRLTLIYTPGVRGGYQHQATQDWGRNVMTYSLMGHTDTWEKAGTQWDSAELNQPLIAFQTDRHPGIAGPSWSLATSSSKDVSLESVKQAEKGDEVVVRLNELAGESHQGVKIKFAAPILSAREIDGQERTIGKANISNGQLDVDMTPYEPRAFALKLGKSASGLAPAASTSLDLPYNLVGISSGFAAHDGNFDNAGYSIPGDMLPSKIVSNGITFVTGPKGKKNVLAMDGQTLRLPAGTHRRLYILGASAGADTNVAFTFGNETREAKLQSWDGYIGQWDSRQWGGVVPELAYDWHNPMVGLVPGYIKREPVAWYADHKRDASGGDDIYAFCYLFKTSVPIPDGAQEVTLVKNPEARIAALTVSDNPADEVRPAQPLYDVFNHQDLDGPSISVADPIPGAEKIVTIEHPLYWSDSTPIRYTMDGSAPTPTSALYRGPFAVGASGLLTVGEVTAEGKVVSLSKKEVQVQDSTPATVVGATDLPDTNVIKVEFSEPVDPASAEDPGNYAVSTGDSVSSAKLAEDGKTLTLSLSSPVPANSSLTVKGVKDFGGLASNSTVDVKPLQPVYVHDEAMTFDGNGRGYRQTSLPNLPTAGKSHWTINMFVKMDRQAGDLTILGGFGSGQDEGGAERFIIENDGHIYFWGSNVDIDSGVPYDLNRWQMITATYDGKVVRLYKDGKEIKSDAAELNDAVNMVRLATPPAWENGHRFAGSIAGMTVWNEALSPSFLATLTAGAPKS
jgi:alpha-mannosidase